MVAVEGDDVGPPAERLEGVTAAAAPEVEEVVAALHAEAVVVDGQHARPCAARARNARARNSDRYCSTVPSAVAAQV